MDKSTISTIDRVKAVVEPFCQLVLSDQAYRSDLLSRLDKRVEMISPDPEIFISFISLIQPSSIRPKGVSSIFIANMFLGPVEYAPVPGRYYVQARSRLMALVGLVSDPEPFYRSIEEHRCISRWMI